jgi:hypothetical protein
VDHVQLGLSPGADFACLCEITGAVEQAVDGVSTVDAIRLVDGLLAESASGGLSPGGAATLVAADRDRVLAAVYVRTYGSRVASTVRCTHCGAPFDLDFSLDELLASVAKGEEANAMGTGRLPDGSFRAAGLRFRLPTGEDECAILGLPPEKGERALLRRCLLEPTDGDADGSQSDAVQAAMECVAPLVDLELGAQCPECGQPQLVSFDIQHYLLSSLLRERSQLALELHSLAAAYGWSLQEILALPRSQRRALVALVEAQGTPSGRFRS